MEPAFNQGTLNARLSALSAPQRLMFAVSCYFAAEQHYRAFANETGWGDAAQMHGWAVQLWNVATGTSALSDRALQDMNARWNTLLPDLDAFSSPLTSAALDAALILTYATDAAASGSVEDASNAGCQSVTLADMLAQEAEKMHPQDPHLEKKILAHPLMQSELQRQAQVLRTLASGGALTP